MKSIDSHRFGQFLLKRPKINSNLVVRRVLKKMSLRVIFVEPVWTKFTFPFKSTRFEKILGNDSELKEPDWVPMTKDNTTPPGGRSIFVRKWKKIIRPFLQLLLRKKVQLFLRLLLNLCQWLTSKEYHCRQMRYSTNFTRPTSPNFSNTRVPKMSTSIETKVQIETTSWFLGSKKTTGMLAKNWSPIGKVVSSCSQDLKDTAAELTALMSWKALFQQ